MTSSIKTMPSYEAMKTLYQAWMSNPVDGLTQAQFFKAYGWTRKRFFDEAHERGDDV